MPSRRTPTRRLPRRARYSTRAALITDFSDSIGWASVRWAERVLKSASLSFTVTVRARSPCRRRSVLTRTASRRSSRSITSSSCRSRPNVSSRLTCFCTSRGVTMLSSIPRTRRCSHAPARSPRRACRSVRLQRWASAIVSNPMRSNVAEKRGPTIGRSASRKGARKAASRPGTTQRTPVAPVPGFGLASSTAILATKRDVPPPIETESPVAANTAERMRCAVASSDSWPYSASVPPISQYHSSILDACTTGA